MAKALEAFIESTRECADAMDSWQGQANHILDTDAVSKAVLVESMPPEQDDDDD